MLMTVKFMPGALVLTLAMLLRLVNCRFIIIIISSSVDKVTTLVHRLAACLTNVEDLMMASRLRLTASKTEVMTRSCYYQLRQLRPIIRSLSIEWTRTLVQTFISCRLDYCNSLLYGISNGLLRRLQSVQNAAAHLVAGTRG